MKKENEFSASLSTGSTRCANHHPWLQSATPFGVERFDEGGLPQSRRFAATSVTQVRSPAAPKGITSMALGGIFQFGECEMISRK